MQVVLNLLSNAGRFTPAGGVDLRAWCEGQNVVVAVSDTGPGIATENQAKLFQPFQQLDGSLRRSHGGTGLGLSISKRFVEMHEGKMWLESPARRAEGQAGKGGPGTTFYFSLPLDAPESLLPAHGGMRWLNPYQPYEERVRPSRAPAPSLVPRYVLLEQGNSLVRRFREYMNGAEIVCVRDVAEARHELGRSPARALVVNTPSLGSPLVSAEQLTSLPFHTPVVTCWVPTEDEAARKLGVVCYLVKPITRESLVSALESLGDEIHNVLLVDDEPEIVRLFSRVLASAGHTYRVLRANDGQRALDLMRERRPDVVLLDLVLPGVDGFNVLRVKNADPAIKDIPVVVISSLDPIGQPIASDTLTVTRGGGLSMRDLAACVEAVSGALTPSTQA